MPLRHYGVAIGSFVRFTRDQRDQFGRWYHGHITVATPAGRYESALDVDTPTGVGISFRVIHDLSLPAFAAVRALPDGFHALRPAPTSGALDYLRSPMLHLPAPVAREHSARLLSAPSPRFGRTGWVRSTGDNALAWLEQQLPGSRRVYLFGDHYQTGLGVHDVHLNQGDPFGSQWYPSDGVWQDGAVVIERPGGQLLAWLVMFNSQSLHTDAKGHPL